MRATRGKAVRLLLSWLLLAGGAFFLAAGARELWLSHFGQQEISAEWKSVKPTTAAPAAVAVSPELGNAVCRLLIPRLDAHFFVVEGTDRDALRVGPGHMPGSALPGTAGNCVIAGHRDTHFRMLKDVREGDEILLQTHTGEFRYRVTQTAVVSPRNKEALRPSTSPVLNLITCYPFYYLGPAPKRFVVEAALERPGQPEPPRSAEVQPPTPPVAASTIPAARKHRKPATARKARLAVASPPKSAPKRSGVLKRIVNRILRRDRSPDRNAS